MDFNPRQNANANDIRRLRSEGAAAQDTSNDFAYASGVQQTGHADYSPSGNFGTPVPVAYGSGAMVQGNQASGAQLFTSMGPNGPQQYVCQPVGGSAGGGMQMQHMQSNWGGGGVDFGPGGMAGFGTAPGAFGPGAFGAGQGGFGAGPGAFGAGPGASSGGFGTFGGGLGGGMPLPVGGQGMGMTSPGGGQLTALTGPGGNPIAAYIYPADAGGDEAGRRSRSWGGRRGPSKGRRHAMDDDGSWFSYSDSDSDGGRRGGSRRPGRHGGRRSGRPHSSGRHGKPGRHGRHGRRYGDGDSDDDSHGGKRHHSSKPGGGRYRRSEWDNASPGGRRHGKHGGRYGDEDDGYREQLMTVMEKRKVPKTRTVQEPGFKTVKQPMTVTVPVEKTRMKEVWVKKVIPQKYTVDEVKHTTKEIQVPTTIMREVTSMELVDVPVKKMVKVPVGGGTVVEDGQVDGHPIMHASSGGHEPIEEEVYYDAPNGQPISGGASGSGRPGGYRRNEWDDGVPYGGGHGGPQGGPQAGGGGYRRSEWDDALPYGGAHLGPGGAHLGAQSGGHGSSGGPHGGAYYPGIGQDGRNYGSHGGAAGGGGYFGSPGAGKRTEWGEGPGGMGPGGMGDSGSGPGGGIRRTDWSQGDGMGSGLSGPGAGRRRTEWSEFEDAGAGGSWAGQGHGQGLHSQEHSHGHGGHGGTPGYGSHGGAHGHSQGGVHSHSHSQGQGGSVSHAGGGGAGAKMFGELNAHFGGNGPAAMGDGETVYTSINYHREFTDTKNPAANHKEEYNKTVYHSSPPRERPASPSPRFGVASAGYW